MGGVCMDLVFVDFISYAALFAAGSLFTYFISIHLF